MSEGGGQIPAQEFFPFSLVCTAHSSFHYSLHNSKLLNFKYVRLGLQEYRTLQKEYDRCFADYQSYRNRMSYYQKVLSQVQKKVSDAEGRVELSRRETEEWKRKYLQQLYQPSREGAAEDGGDEADEDGVKRKRSQGGEDGEKGSLSTLKLLFRTVIEGDEDKAEEILESRLLKRLTTYKDDHGRTMLHHAVFKVALLWDA